MKRKILIAVLSLCVLATGMPLGAETAFAGTGMDEKADKQQLYAQTAEDMPQYESANSKKCDYSPTHGTAKADGEACVCEGSAKSGKLGETTSVYSAGRDISTAASEKRYARKFIEAEIAKGNADESLVTVYDRIKEGIENRKDTIAVSIRTGSNYDLDVTVEEVDRVVELVKEDYPEFFWLSPSSYMYTYYTYGDSDTRYIANIELEYFFEAEELAEAQNAFDEEVTEILNELEEKVGASASDYEKELWIHDYLAKTNDYISYSPYAHSAYGALVEGEAVCEGYTRAFQLLLNQLDIENHTVTGSDQIGSGAAINHIWNMVKLDGKWYQVDVTWDDQGNSAADIYHIFFNMSRTTLEKTHTIIMDETGLPIPSDDEHGTEYFYFNHSSNSSKKFSAKATSFDSDKFVTEVATQMNADDDSNGIIHACIYAPDENSEDESLGDKFMCSDDGALINRIVSALKTENTSKLSYGYEANSNGSGKEYHLYILLGDTADIECSNYNAVLLIGVPQMSDIRIRLYPSASSAETIESEIAKHRKDDELHIAVGAKTVVDSDEGWYEMEGFGIFTTYFILNDIPNGEYKLAVFKRGSGVLYIKDIVVGSDGLNMEAAANDSDNCWWTIYTPGDLDDNDRVDFADAIFLKRYIAGWDAYVKNGNWFAANIDGSIDGNSASINDEVTIKDLMILERHLAGQNGYESLWDFAGGSSTADNAA